MSNCMIKYYYETHTGNRPKTLHAANDEAALDKLREKFGECLQTVIIVYEEKSKGHMRTVWLNA